MNILDMLLQKAQTKGSNSSPFSTGKESCPDLTTQMLEVWHICGFSTFGLHAGHCYFCTNTSNIVKPWHNSHGQEELQPPPPLDMKVGRTNNKVHIVSQKNNPGF